MTKNFFAFCAAIVYNDSEKILKGRETFVDRKNNRLDREVARDKRYRIARRADLLRRTSTCTRLAGIVLYRG